MTHENYAPSIRWLKKNVPSCAIVTQHACSLVKFRFFVGYFPVGTVVRKWNYVIPDGMAVLSVVLDVADAGTITSHYTNKALASTHEGTDPKMASWRFSALRRYPGR